MMIDQATKLREMVSHQKQMEVITNKILITPPQKEEIKRGRILAITSGKGGVGKTNFVINLGLELCKAGKKVVVVDLDLGLANVDILLDLAPKYNMEDFIQGKKEISEILADGPKGLKILPGGSGAPRLADLDDLGRENFIAGFLWLVNDYDYVLLDTAAGISKNVIEFALIADDVIVVTTPEPTAITDAYAAIKVIGTRNREINIFLLFNMVATAGEAKSYFYKVSQVIHQFLKIQVHDLGFVFNDTCVHQSIMKRKPFVLTYPFSPASRSLHLVAKKLISLTQEKEKREPRFLRMFREMFKPQELAVGE